MKILSVFIIFFIHLIMVPVALSEISVYDIVTISGREVMLRAKAKTGLFAEGGSLVEFFVNGRSIGKNLSGGDGIAFKPFVPAREGAYKLRITSGSESDEGTLLAVKKGARLVFIDVEGSLLEKFLSLKPRSGSVAAVKKIGRRYPLIFLQASIVGERMVKSWLRENGFPAAPVLSWNRGNVFREMRDKTLVIKAVIGKQEVVESAKEYKPLAFSFDAAGGDQSVQDWEEVVKGIK